MFASQKPPNFLVKVAGGTDSRRHTRQSSRVSHQDRSSSSTEIKVVSEDFGYLHVTEPSMYSRALERERVKPVPPATWWLLRRRLLSLDVNTPYSQPAR